MTPTHKFTHLSHRIISTPRLDHNLITPILSANDNLTALILSTLDLSSLLQFSQVCRDFHHLVSQCEIPIIEGCIYRFLRDSIPMIQESPPEETSESILPREESTFIAGYYQKLTPETQTYIDEFIDTYLAGPKAVLLESLHSNQSLVHIKLCVLQNPLLLVAKNKASFWDKSTNDNGQTALIEAAQAGDVSLCELLINIGAGVHIPDNFGTTAIMEAARWGHVPVCELLLQFGADINATNDVGETPLMIAISAGKVDVYHLLIEQGADMTLRNIFDSPLTLAIEKNNMAVCKSLLSNGDLIESTDLHGETALFYAIRFQYYDICELLLQSGANVDQKNERRMTPLMFAAQTRDYIACSLLLQYNPDIHETDNSGNSALSLADSHNQKECYRLLENYMPVDR